jgi:carbonic anhydrase
MALTMERVYTHGEHKFINKGVQMNHNKFQLQPVLTFVFAFLFAHMSPASAIEVNPSKNPMERLTQGNQRYVTSTTVCHEDWTAKRSALLENQKPFAVIVACSDSRVPPEIIFDQSLGDLFVVRVAGNIVDDFAVGSIEYGVNILGANLVLVLGHSNCGAVDAALKGMKFDNHIQEVLNAIQPAIAATKGESGDLLEKAIKANVRIVEEKLKTSKPLLAKLLESGSLRIMGAYYDLESGKVEFLDKP